MRKTKKTLALFLVLAMVLTLFAGVAQASTDVRITSSTAVVSPGSNVNLGTITIARDPADGFFPIGTAGTATVITVTLPSGVTWDEADVTSTLATATPTSSPTAAWTHERVDAQMARFRVTSTTSSVTPLTIRPRVDVSSGFRGDINVTVAVQSEDATATEIFWTHSETERLATVAAEGTTATAIDATNVQRGVGQQAVGSIRIRELTHDSLSTSTPVTLSLPAGVTFAQATGLSSPAGRSTATTTAAGTDGVLETINITGIQLNIGPNVPDGPVIVTISGGDATAATVTVATVGVVGAVSVSARNLPADPVTAGQLGVEVGDLRLTESHTDALLRNRTISLTLPVGFTWNTVDVAANIVTNATTPDVSDGGRTLTYWTTTDPAPAAGTSNFEFPLLRINTRIDAPVGDIVVTVGGTAGASGTAVVGTLRRPVTVTAVTVPNVRADAAGQALGNLVITEAFPGAIMGGMVEVVLPAGFTFDAAPTVTISDVVGTQPAIVGSVTREASNTQARVVLSAAVTPTNAATITISGMRASGDRAQRVLLGPLSVNVRGSAVLEATSSDPGDTLNFDVTHSAAVGANIATVDVANVVSATARTTVFTVDSTAFTVDGVAQPALEVAPFVDPASNRTLVPLRAVAHAAGVLDRSIGWDEATQRVTLASGDRFIQFTIDVKSMLVNGVVMPIDQAPRVINGRTVLPVRALELALGVALEWDGTARTVTVKLD